MYRKIQESKKKGLLKAEISRDLRLDPGTVAKYYDMSEQEYREYAQAHRYRDKTFDRYMEDILEVYKRNGFQRLSMSSVYDYLEEVHGALPGTEKTFRNYIGYLEETDQLEIREQVREYQKVAELQLGKQMHGVAPFLWTPYPLRRRCSPWGEQDHRIRLSFGSRWSN
jgi:hypothetical protein